MQIVAEATSGNLHMHDAVEEYPPKIATERP